MQFSVHGDSLAHLDETIPTSQIDLLQSWLDFEPDGAESTVIYGLQSVVGEVESSQVQHRSEDIAF